MVQYMRPSSDINAGWVRSTGTYRYACIDEDPYDDSDYIYTSSSGAYQECKLSAPSETPASGAGALKFRLKKASSGSGNITVSLRVGSTVIKTSGTYNQDFYSTITLNLTEAEMASITDWSNVRVRVTSYVNQLLPTTLYVSHVVFEIPDAPIKNGLEMGCAF